MERVREWAESYQGAGDEAAKEQAVAVDREAKLRKWTEHDIESDTAHRKTMIKASGRSTVPQIFINGTHVGGSDDLARLDADGELDKLLAGGAPAN